MPTTTSRQTSIPSATPYPKGRPGFLKTVGQQLTLDGYQYRMLGFNIWRGAVSFPIPNTGYTLGNPATTPSLTQTLTDMNAYGQFNTVRVWCFQQLFTTQTSGASYTWGPLDYCLSTAASFGMKVVCTLVDQWNYEGPPQLDSTWYTAGGGYTSRVFSNGTNAIEMTNYRQFVHDIVTRYKDNPTVAMWELVNEPDVSNPDTSCPANAASMLLAFLNDVAGQIKAIDPDHLVSLGTAANGNCGTLSGDFQTVLASPYWDIASFHDYEGATNAGAFETNNGLNVRIPQCQALNKPIYIGEVGIHLNAAPVSGNQTTRANLLGNKLGAQLGMTGVVGFLPWHFDSRGVGTDDYVYPPNDPALAVMAGYRI